VQENDHSGRAALPPGVRPGVRLVLSRVQSKALAKDSNLAQAAMRYKVDVAKLFAEVRSELARKNEKRDAKVLPRWLGNSWTLKQKMGVSLVANSRYIN
jgi:hypothetical protein